VRKNIDLNHPANITEVGRWKYWFMTIHTLSIFWQQNGMSLITKRYGFWLQNGMAFGYED